MSAPSADSSGDGPTVISTFAGCGGSSLGYTLAGFRELLAVEWDDNAVATFRLNFPEVPVYHGDIAKLTGAECLRLAGIAPGELDVLDGSPPCQGFSTAGKRKWDDPRNSLFREYARLLQELQPRCFVMENVTGMVKGCMKQAYLAIVAALRACGYRVKGEVLNAMYFNVPQSRERVIIIGVRNDLGIGPSHPKPQTKPACALCAISDVKEDTLNPYGLRNFNQARRYMTHHKPSPTLTKSEVPGSDLPFAGSVRIGVRGAVRIASFPDSWQWAGKWTDAINRIGNSVPPNLMRAIAEHLRQEILHK
jgi:DNA (cytosine-5)-methyltransferase 1